MFISGLKRAKGQLLDKDYQKAVVLILFILLCAGVAYYSHFILHSEVVFTHLFYTPVVLAGLWWGRRGTWVAVLLGALLLVSHFLYGMSTPLTDDVMRSLMFVMAGLIVCMIREKALGSEKNLRET